MYETSIELQLMILFIVSYSITTVNKSQKPFWVYLNNLVYSFSGLLLSVYVFRISALTEYIEYQWVVGFLLALTFKDLLPTIMTFTTDVINGKLSDIKNKILGEPNA